MVARQPSRSVTSPGDSASVPGGQAFLPAQSRPVAAQYGISAIPGLLVFKGGQIAAERTGLVGKAALKALIER
jgi:hypothetical protein